VSQDTKVYFNEFFLLLRWNKSLNVSQGIKVLLNKNVFVVRWMMAINFSQETNKYIIN